MDLNFYNNFLSRYNELREEATTPHGRKIEDLIAEFVWDDDAINYCRGKRPFSGAIDWIGAKRILVVMNFKNKHFLTVEILMNKGVINVYDSNLPVFEEWEFFICMEPLLELFPNLLKQSGIINHFSEKLLNDRWSFESRKYDLPKNKTVVACRSYSLAFTEC
ncbi:hypothetical protein FXO38_23529 [Capsicum annuum]|nr:hypothetical protein FXO38_23529 [Capsicum annuum]